MLKEASAMSKDKSVSRDKKKGSNGNLSGGESNVGNGNETCNVGIKSEPMERERERGDEEVKEEPPVAVEEPQAGELNEDNTSADVKPPDLTLPDCK